jgi:hypothetical protein
LRAHLPIVDPGPGVAVDRGLGVRRLAHAVEFVVGVDLVVRIPAHVSRAAARGKAGAVEFRVKNDEEAAIHPLRMIVAVIFSARTHGARLNVGF